MQDTKRFEDRHPAAGPGLSGALGPLRRCGEEEQGGSEGLLEALHAGVRRRVKKKCDFKIHCGARKAGGKKGR